MKKDWQASHSKNSNKKNDEDVEVVEYLTVGGDHGWDQYHKYHHLSDDDYGHDHKHHHSHHHDEDHGHHHHSHAHTDYYPAHDYDDDHHEDHYHEYDHYRHSKHEPSSHHHSHHDTYYVTHEPTYIKGGEYPHKDYHYEDVGHHDYEEVEYDVPTEVYEIEEYVPSEPWTYKSEGQKYPQAEERYAKRVVEPRTPQEEKPAEKEPE